MHLFWFLVFWCIIPLAEKLSSNYTVASEAFLVDQLFIFQTIFQPSALDDKKHVGQMVTTLDQAVQV